MIARHLADYSFSLAVQETDPVNLANAGTFFEQTNVLIMADTKQMLELGYTIMLVVMPKASREAVFNTYVIFGTPLYPRIMVVSISAMFIIVLFSRVLGIGFMGSKLSGRLRRLNQQRMCAWSEAYIHVCVLEMDLRIAAV